MVWIDQHPAIATTIALFIYIGLVRIVTFIKRKQ